MKKVLILLLLLFCFSLVGCSKATVYVKYVYNYSLPPSNTYKAYDRDYDSPPDSTSYWWGGYNFTQGDLLPYPDNEPSRVDYNFTAWYQEEGCINAWDFQHDVINQTFRLYAGWVAK